MRIGPICFRGRRWCCRVHRECNPVDKDHGLEFVSHAEFRLVDGRSAPLVDRLLAMALQLLVVVRSSQALTGYEVCTSRTEGGHEEGYDRGLIGSLKLLGICGA